MTAQLLLKKLRIFTPLDRRESIVHWSVWIGGWIVVNIPQLEVTIGVFHSGNYSLILPSIYGTFLNAIIFYTNIELAQRFVPANVKKVAVGTFLWFFLVSTIECVLDSLYYYFVYTDFSQPVLGDIIFGTLLMNLMFFYLPGLVYGIIRKGLVQKENYSKIRIKDGVKEIYISFEDLLFIESDSNYSKYVCRSGNYIERRSLVSLENELPTQFVRCHKSYIINSILINKKSASELEIEGKRIPIGRKYSKAIAQLQKERLSP